MKAYGVISRICGDNNLYHFLVKALKKIMSTNYLVKYNSNDQNAVCLSQNIFKYLSAIFRRLNMYFAKSLRR